MRQFVILGALLVIGAALSPAEVLTFEFTGTVTILADPFAVNPDVFAGFQSGDLVTGRFTYEPGSLPDQIHHGFDSDGADNYPRNSILEIVTVDGFSFINGPFGGGAAAFRGSQLDPNVASVVIDGFGSHPFGFENHKLNFNDSLTFVDETFALPTVDKLLRASVSGSILLLPPGKPIVELFYSVDSITQVNTPEPATWFTVVASLAVLLIKRAPKKETGQPIRSARRHFESTA